MTANILIVGEGLLTDYVYENLSLYFQVTRQVNFDGIPEEIDLALVLQDGWNPWIHQQAEKKFRSLGIPWLRSFTSFGEGMIGPLVRPDTPGCSRCADVRCLIAGQDRKEMSGLARKMAATGGIHRDAWASRTGFQQMALVISKETLMFLNGEQSLSEERLLIINLRTLKNSSHFVLPDPLCPVCSQLPDDSEVLAQISLQSIAKISEESYRCRSLDELKKGLVKDYLDDRTGIFNAKMQNSLLPFADVTVNMPLFNGDEVVAGRSNSYEISKLIAILEGLERYCGIGPRGKRRMVRDSYRNLAEKAMNPERVGLHAKEQYERPNFPFKPYNPDVPMNWVWGYSFLQERPILVPELLAYYSFGFEEGFVYETSNGCALGGSLEEAIFHGIMEVIERDSFLLTWYAQLPLPRIDLMSAEDKELQLMVNRVREVAGYELHCFNSTMEHQIPSVWVLAKNRKSKGLNLICASGASLDPISAVKSAIYENAAMMMYGHDERLKGKFQKCKQMLYDPYAVRTMEDHGMLYGLPEAEDRLQFLLDDSRNLQSFKEEFKQVTKHKDLTHDLQEILEKLRHLNLEVIVVDQTTSVTKRNGLYCVKVLIPGMLPMTFGHHLTRVKGLERVLKVPMELGYTKQILTYEQLNPFPHPFP